MSGSIGTITFSSHDTIVASLTNRLVIQSTFTATEYLNATLLSGLYSTFTETSKFTGSLVNSIIITGTFANTSTLNASLTTSILLSGLGSFVTNDTLNGTLTNQPLIQGTIINSDSLVAMVATTSIFNGITFSNTISTSFSLAAQLRLDTHNVLTAPTILHTLTGPAG